MGSIWDSDDDYEEAQEKDRLPPPKEDDGKESDGDVSQKEGKDMTETEQKMMYYQCKRLFNQMKSQEPAMMNEVWEKMFANWFENLPLMVWLGIPLWILSPIKALVMLVSEDAKRVPPVGRGGEMKGKGGKGGQGGKGGEGKKGDGEGPKDGEGKGQGGKGKGGKGSNSNSAPDSKANLKCGFCKQQGHDTPNCWGNPKGQNYKPKKYAKLQAQIKKDSVNAAAETKKKKAKNLKKKAKKKKPVVESSSECDSSDSDSDSDATTKSTKKTKKKKGKASKAVLLRDVEDSSDDSD